MNNKVLARIDDADFRDAVSTGYTWTLYADGRVSAEYTSRWQGSRSGTRYTTEPGFVDVSKLGDDQDSDAEAALTNAVEDIDPTASAQFRQTRRGYVVQ